MTPAPHTIWLASYPKSGNTWVRALLTGLMRAEREIDLDRLGHGPLPSARGHLEHWSAVIASDLTPQEIQWLRPRADLALDQSLRRPRYRKIHDSLFSGLNGAPIIAVQATRAAVYIVRDPRDVAVSFAHHSGESPDWAVKRLGDPSAFADLGPTIELQVRQQLDTWSAHVRGWIEQQLFPVLLVRYEDLHADAARELARIAELAELGADHEAIAAAVHAAAFERLRASERRTGFRERSSRGGEFFRRGITGSWRDELPADLAHQIESDHQAMMKRLGYLSGA